MTLSPDTPEARCAEVLRRWYGLLVPDHRMAPLAQTLADAGGAGGAEAALAALLSGDAEVRDRVTRSVAVSETSFFRHEGHFGVLAEHARARAGRRYEALSAGCSTGEEAWSIAAVLADLEADGVAGRVTGWDLVPSRLAHARRGLYSGWAARNGFGRYERYFERAEPRWRVSETLTRRVAFDAVNLCGGEVPRDRLFDAIFFRNVCIYFDEETTRRVVGQLFQRLAPDGILLVGPCDPVGAGPAGWRHQIADGVRVFHPRRNEEPTATPSPRRRPPRATTHPPRPPARSAPAPLPAATPPAVAGSARGATWEDDIRALADAGRHAEALTLLRQRPSLEPEALLWRGVLSLALERPLDAVEALRRHVYLCPERAAARHWLAAACEAAGLHAEADREQRNAREIEGHAARAR